jgi:hypothetical protein
MLRERQEDHIFQALLKLCNGLEDKLANVGPEEVQLTGDLVRAPNNMWCFLCQTYPAFVQIQKGVNASRADDTKGMKSAIIDWITPPDRDLVPRLNRKHKFDRGFQHETTGALLCPAGVNWNDLQWVVMYARCLLSFTCL